LHRAFRSLLTDGTNV